jgi:hypothetical protein
MPDREREARALRRLLRSFRSPSSYGLVLVMIIGSYVMAVTLPAQWGQTLLLFVQIATVWLALHTSRARGGLRLVRHIGYRRMVDRETMLGALAAYLFIGMAFAFAYRLLGAVQGSPFFGASGDGTLSQDLFFTFVTLTTTGYGNLVPASNPGQSLAVLEALTGQLFLVTAVAKIISAWRPRGWQEAGPDSETMLDDAVEEASRDDPSP